MQIAVMFMPELHLVFSNPKGGGVVIAVQAQSMLRLDCVLLVR